MYIPQPEDSSQHAAEGVNMGESERIISLAGGAALLAAAITRRGAFSIPALLAGAGLLFQGATGNSPLYKAAGINTAVKANPEHVSVPHNQGIHVVRAVTINRSAEDLYNFWHEPGNLPKVIGYIDTIEIVSENRAHWKLKLPGGAPLEFDVEMLTDVPNEVMSWRSLEGAPVQNAGSVRFKPAPAGRGTEVHLTIEFVPPGGILGEVILKLFGVAPNQYVGQMLREFKQVMETGEKATIQGQTSGRLKGQYE